MNGVEAVNIQHAPKICDWLEIFGSSHGKMAKYCMWRWNKQDAVWRKTFCSYSVRREGREAGWLRKHNFSSREPEGLAVKSEAGVCIIQEVYLWKGLILVVSVRTVPTASQMMALFCGFSSDSHLFFYLYFPRHYCIKGNCRHLTTYNAYNLCTFLGLIVIEQWKQPAIAWATWSPRHLLTKYYFLCQIKFLEFWPSTRKRLSDLSEPLLVLTPSGFNIFQLFNVMHGEIKSISRIWIYFFIP